MGEQPAPEKKPFEFSPEQNAIFDAKNGFFYVISNAGSGKTECSAEVYVRAYLDIERALFPEEKGHVSGADQMRILKQILAVTFTRKAAEELSDRIRLKLVGLGVPSPTYKGHPVPLCSTLDRYLQRWVGHPAFFEAWRAFDSSMAQALDRIVGSLGPKAQAHLGKYFHADTPVSYTLFKHWATMLAGDAQEAIVDLLVRLQLGTAPLAGFSLKDLLDAFETFKRESDPAVDRWAAHYLTPFVEIYKKDQHQMLALARSSPPTGNPTTPEQVRHEEMINDWKRVQLARSEFSSIYELARSRGYDPVRNVNGMSSPDVLKAICAGSAFEHIRPIHILGSAYRRIKLHLGLMDFGDYLAVFNAVTSSASGKWLLEQKSEYPKLGFRRKVVIWDEVQDNSPPQFDILKKFQGDGVPYLTIAVGDPFQSLYGFRGSNPYQFINDIEEMRVDQPNSLLSLTCSYRSTKSIVRLGNEIIASLSRHKDCAKPSRTVYEEEGEIVIAPVCNTKAEESAWVISQISAIRKRSDGGGSIMILFRSEMEKHPLSTWFAQNKPEGVQLMTVHASKGLQADNVFVTGLTAGKFPDPRGNLEQEVNAFYVACTRPRRALFLSAPMVTAIEKIDGTIEELLMGPSPFFTEVKDLQERALGAKWNRGQLRLGLNSHSQMQARYISAFEKKRLQIYNEAQTHFSGRKYEAEEKAAPYLGPISAFEAIPVQAMLPPPETVIAKKRSTPVATEEQVAALKAKLRKGFFKNTSPPELSHREKLIAVDKLWIQERDGALEFTADFRNVIRKSA